MRTRLSRWGNSLAIRIPRALVEDLRLRQGGEVDLQVREGLLVVAPVSRPYYDLEDLVRGITPENRHEEVDWGPAVGEVAAKVEAMLR